MCWDTMFVCLQLTGSNRSDSSVCVCVCVCVYVCVSVSVCVCDGCLVFICCSSQDQYWEVCSQEDECSNSNRCGSEYTSQLH